LSQHCYTFLSKRQTKLNLHLLDRLDVLGRGAAASDFAGLLAGALGSGDTERRRFDLRLDAARRLALGDPGFQLGSSHAEVGPAAGAELGRGTRRRRPGLGGSGDVHPHSRRPGPAGSR